MSLKNFFLRLIFPPHCLGCARGLERDTALCDACEQSVPIHTTLFCGRCGSRLASGKKMCHKDFPYVLGAATNFGNDVIRSAVHALKFNYAKQASNVLGKYLIRYVTSLALPPHDFLILPIPLSLARLRKRGFNQSELIAKVFANHFRIAVENGALVRVKNTKPQSETKGLRERRENIAGAFAVRNPELIAGNNILLVDDVTTSGATLLEAATVLKNAGARKIIALAVARA